MKIAIIGINFAPEMTGCGPYTADLADELHKLGHEVTVFTGLPHYPQWKVPEEFRGQIRRSDLSRGYEVNRLWHYVPKKNSTLRRAMYEVTFALNLFVQTFRRKFELVLVVSPSLLSIFPALLLKHRGAQLKVLVQDLIAPAARLQRGSQDGIADRVTTKIEGFLLKSATSLGVISSGFTKQLTDYGVDIDKISITENYPLFNFRGLSHEEERARWGWASNKKIVLYTGNFGRKQGLKNLIEAAKILQLRRSNLHFVLVGDGNEAKELKFSAQGLRNVEFWDLIPRELYPSLLMSADILIVHEGVTEEALSSPSKLELYVASGRPILVVCSSNSPAFSLAMRYSIPQCNAADPLLLSQYLQEHPFHENERSHFENTLYEKSQVRINWALSKN